MPSPEMPRRTANSPPYVKSHRSGLFPHFGKLEQSAEQFSTMGLELGLKRPPIEAAYLPRAAGSFATMRVPSHISMSRPSSIVLAFAITSVSESHSITADGPAIRLESVSLYRR